MLDKIENTNPWTFGDWGIWHFCRECGTCAGEAPLNDRDSFFHPRVCTYCGAERSFVSLKVRPARRDPISSSSPSVWERLFGWGAFEERLQLHPSEASPTKRDGSETFIKFWLEAQ